MQFLEPSFNAVIARHRPPPGNASPPSRYNVHDAIYAAAYLRDAGANHGDLRATLYTYNHSQSYVDQVLTQARRYYTQPTPGTAPNTSGTPSASGCFTGEERVRRPSAWRRASRSSR